MSVPNSTILPRSNPISGDADGMLDFDGEAEILRAWGAGLTPDPDLTVSEWADRHRMLSGRALAEPGRYRTARTPYMGEIMDRLSPGDPTQRIVFMKAAQVGATEAGNNWIGFAIHQAPGPMLAVRPTVEFARLEWQKLRERNEALDCRVYACAAAWIAGADRWTDEKWRDLEDQLGVADASADPAGQINSQAQTLQGKPRSDWLGRRGGWF